MWYGDSMNQNIDDQIYNYSPSYIGVDGKAVNLPIYSAACRKEDITPVRHLAGFFNSSYTGPMLSISTKK